MHQQQPGLATRASSGASNSLSPSGPLRSSVAVEETVDNSRSGIDNASGGSSRVSEGRQLTNLGFSSPLRGQATVAAMMSASSPSIVPPPSLRALVAAAALARDAAPTAAAVLEDEAAAIGEVVEAIEISESSIISTAAAPPTPALTRDAAPAAEAVLGDEAAAIREGAEARAISEASVMTTTAAPPMPSEEVAPVSGSFNAAPIACVCCSHIDAVGDTSRTTGSNARNADSPNGLPSSAVPAPHVGRPHPPSSSSSSPPAPSSQALFRRLPCGHSAHEACLIPLILESVGRGDPSRCLCPLDSFSIFSVLSRRRRRCRSGTRSRRPGSDGHTSTAAATSSATRDHCRGTRSASSATAAPPASRTGGGNCLDRHARAAAARELLRRNAAAGFGGGGANPPDVLGIALFGSGLAQQPPPPPPPSAGRHSAATAFQAGLDDRQRDRRASSVRESRLMRRRASANGTKEGGKGSEGGGNRTRGRCRNVGRGADGDAGPREGSSCGEPGLCNTTLFLGGEGMMPDAAGGASAASRTRGAEECDIETAVQSRRDQQRKTPCVLRGSTISGSGGRGGGGGDITRHSGCSTGRAGAADAASGSARGLALSTVPLASSARERTDDSSRGGIRHSCLREPPGELGGRGSRVRGRRELAETAGNPSASTISAPGSPLAAMDATVEEHPSGHPIRVNGMALMAALI